MSGKLGLSVWKTAIFTVLAFIVPSASAQVITPRLNADPFISTRIAGEPYGIITVILNGNDMDRHRGGSRRVGENPPARRSGSGDMDMGGATSVKIVFGGYADHDGFTRPESSKAIGGVHAFLGTTGDFYPFSDVFSTDVMDMRTLISGVLGASVANARPSPDHIFVSGTDSNNHVGKVWTPPRRQTCDGSRADLDCAFVRPFGFPH